MQHITFNKREKYLEELVNRKSLTSHKKDKLTAGDMLLIRKVAKHVFEKINVTENERNKELTEDELTKVERPRFLKRVHNLDGKPKYRNLVQRDIA